VFETCVYSGVERGHTMCTIDVCRVRSREERFRIAVTQDSFLRQPHVNLATALGS
jgi:hypothetical protein